MTETSEDWTNVGAVEITDELRAELPDPVAWRLLVMPQEPEKVTAGGIVLTTSHQDAQRYNTHVGLVLKKGPVVGQRDPINIAPFNVREGDWVVYGKYAGQRIEVRGVKLIFLNDEDILATTLAPRMLRPAV